MKVNKRKIDWKMSEKEEMVELKECLNRSLLSKLRDVHGYENVTTQGDWVVVSSPHSGILSASVKGEVHI